MTERPYRNFLSIGEKFKGVPYGPAPRDNGDQNHGFKLLKDNLHLADEIPELQDDRALRDLVVAINSDPTGLLTLGCLSGRARDQRGSYIQGYVEFAFNSASLISDASNYFPLFFHFSEALRKNNFPHQMTFDWEINPVCFADSQSYGFTCWIFLRTLSQDNQQTAQSIWDESLHALGDFLGSIPPERDDLLFPRDG